MGQAEAGAGFRHDHKVLVRAAEAAAGGAGIICFSHTIFSGVFTRQSSPLTSGIDATPRMSRKEKKNSHFIPPYWATVPMVLVHVQ